MVVRYIGIHLAAAYNRVFSLILFLKGIVLPNNSIAKNSQIIEGGEYSSDLKHTVYSTLGDEIHDRVICVDGFKIFQTDAYEFGEKIGGVSASNIQLYEERDGKVVPVLCKQEKTEAK